jgi:hypothetical protein
MTNEAGLLNLWSDHDPWRITKIEYGDVECVAQLHKARAFVGTITIDRAAEVIGVIGHNADGSPLNADKTRDDRPAERPAQLQSRSFVG